MGITYEVANDMGQFYNHIAINLLPQKLLLKSRREISREEGIERKA